MVLTVISRLFRNFLWRVHPTKGDELGSIYQGHPVCSALIFHSVSHKYLMMRPKWWLSWSIVSMETPPHFHTLLGWKLRAWRKATHRTGQQQLDIAPSLQSFVPSLPRACPQPSSRWWLRVPRRAKIVPRLCWRFWQPGWGCQPFPHQCPWAIQF